MAGKLYIRMSYFKTMKAPSLIVPILYSKDVKESIRYYTEVLGFESHWEWEDPPTFGGVDWGEIRVFFCKDGQGSPGTWICMNVEDIDLYCETIKARGASIVALPDDKPWGLREMLVQDPDGHMIRFGQEIDCE